MVLSLSFYRWVNRRSLSICKRIILIFTMASVSSVTPCSLVVDFDH